MEPAPSPFDLRWRMFGVAVRVHPTFWLFSLFMGWAWMQKGFIYVLLWVLCTFLSILVHELGHVAAGRVFGQPGRIILYSFGGLAIGNYHQTHRWQRIVIALAGPAAGFGLYGLVLLLDRYWFTQSFYNARFDPRFDETIHFLLFMNLFWNTLNLLPVFPLDGGQVLREVCGAISESKGLRWALGLSFVLGGLIAVYCLLLINRERLGIPAEKSLFWPEFDDPDRVQARLGAQPLFTAILFGLLAVQNFMMYRQLEYEESMGEDEE